MKASVSLGAPVAPAPAGSVGLPSRLGLRGLVVRTVLRWAVGGYLGLLALAERLGPRTRPRSGGEHVLLTLNFHAPGWPRALLGPLTRSPRCDRLTLVTTAEVSGLDGAELIHPPRWLHAVAGATVARLVTFAIVAMRDRPSVVGGVHLLLNGLVAGLVAPAVGAQSLYICVGGPNEVVGGGLHSENRLFGRLAGADDVLERRLVRVARSFDAIVAMGRSGAAYFRERGAKGRLAVIPSGVDPSQRPATVTRDVDVILVARLVPLKRLDLFVETMARVAAEVRSLHAVVIGVGPMLEPAQELARARGLEGHIRFLGREPDAFSWLARAKVFLLPSDTEGVSISLIEAMLCGAVPVVSHVGDLGDVVQQGVTGFLVRDRTPDNFAAPIITVLNDAGRRAQLSAAAEATARQFTPDTLATRWTDLLAPNTAPPGSRA